jgi:hypothetical protein
MCSDTPMRSIYSEKDFCLGELAIMRAKHFVDTGCNKSMTFTTYKESHIWWLKEVPWDVQLVEEKDRACVCNAAEGKCKYPQCKTGGKEKILELTARVLELEQENETLTGCYNEFGPFEREAFERLSEIVVDDILQKDKPKPIVDTVECHHQWQVGEQKGRKIAQCVHCLKVEVMELKQLNKEGQKSFVTQTVGGR